MKRYGVCIITATLFIFEVTTTLAADLNESTQAVGRFGTVHLYRQNDHPDKVVLFVSGDGGWNQGVVDMARELAGMNALVVGIDITHYAAGLADNGVAVVGLDTLRYFWTARTPDIASRDLSRLLDYYLLAWRKKDVTLIGYSLGADVLPFMAARLPENQRSRIRLITLLAPDRTTAFEFHFTDWIGGSDKSGQYPILPEVEKLHDLPMLCFYGKKEHDSLCRDRLSSNVTVIPVDGAHHLGGDDTFIVKHILEAMEPL